MLASAILEVILQPMNIAVFEDMETWKSLLEQIIDTEPRHEIICEAETLEAAEAAVRKMRMGEIAVQAVVLDGNLAGSSGYGTDATRILDALHEIPLERRPFTIGFSAVPMCDYGLEVDIDMQKNKRISTSFYTHYPRDKSVY